MGLGWRREGRGQRWRWVKKHISAWRANMVLVDDGAGYWRWPGEDELPCYCR